MKVDIESIVKEVRGILDSKLNTKISEVENSKASEGAPLPGGLAIIHPEAYYEQSWSDSIINRAPAIFYGVEDVQATGIGPSTIEVVTLFVAIILVDSGMDVHTSKRIHRYSRALKEVFQENYDKFASSGQFKIATIRPESYRLNLDTSEEIKVGGVTIQTAIA